ncbi:hypothetical protein LH704_22650 [Burkholderia cenocepacia]|uniref:hypothetical protein n=1 Tax=Burkholderia cenocepacia TaxID=95486 RepID=UPI001F2B8D3C|nr:hypothetical protein [Burkholderia cenocepacia]MCF1368961.1 hypothetical protein [Burkholderia cenocepacia]MCF1387008.1 hypothetical protein [Burkholderia cenocepacia]
MNAITYVGIPGKVAYTTFKEKVDVPAGRRFDDGASRFPLVAYRARAHPHAWLKR